MRSTNSISTRISLYFLIASLLIFLIAVSIQHAVSYYNQMQAIDDGLREIEENKIPILIDTLYDLDENSLNIQLTTIYQLEFISGINLEAGKIKIKKGIITNNNSQNSYQYNLVYNGKYRKEPQILGKLVIDVSTTYVKKNLIYHFVTSIITFSMQIIVIALIFRYLVNFLIIRHMQHIANFFRDKDINSLASRILLNRFRHIEPCDDELDLICNSFNRLQEKLVTEIGRNKKLAMYDTLTDLPNRFLLSDRFKQAVGSIDREKSKILAVIFLDLNNFKSINESQGHQVGDQVLIEIANRLTSRVRSTDTVARFGSDEFVILANEIETTTQVHSICQELLNSFSDDISIAGKNYHITFSVGVSIYPNDSTTLNNLLKCAELAMRKSKENQTSHIIFYNDVMQVAVNIEYEIINSISNAIKNDQFFLVYQPIYDINNEQMVSAEALIRWKHPDRGVLSPNMFISTIESSQFVVQFGMYVIKKAFAFYKENMQKHDMTLSINLSVKQLVYPEFAAEVLQLAYDSEIDPKHIIFEITESIFITDSTALMINLRALTEYKFNFSIDDFGTGYSCLSYLSTLPIAILKIDKSFIDSYEVEKVQSIIRSIITLAHNLELTVVAEGVETVEQKDLLKTLKCDKIQGYYFSKPLSEEHFIARLSRQVQDDDM